MTHALQINHCNYRLIKIGNHQMTLSFDGLFICISLIVFCGFVFVVICGHRLSFIMISHVQNNTNFL